MAACPFIKPLFPGELSLVDNDIFEADVGI